MIAGTNRKQTTSTTTVGRYNGVRNQERKETGSSERRQWH